MSFGDTLIFKHKCRADSAEDLPRGRWWCEAIVSDVFEQAKSADRKINFYVLNKRVYILMKLKTNIISEQQFNLDFSHLNFVIW